MSKEEFDELVDDVMTEKIPDATPEPGETYQRIPGEAEFAVVDLPWQNDNHRLWAKRREKKGLQPPFYVRSPQGEIGWVPWPGAKVAVQGEAAWEMDLLRAVTADLKKVRKENR